MALSAIGTPHTNDDGSRTPLPAFLRVSSNRFSWKEVALSGSTGVGKSFVALHRN